MGAEEHAAGTSSIPAPEKENKDGEEVVFYEGHGGSSVELALSLALTATLIFAPLTIASIGRRFWYVYMGEARRGEEEGYTE